MLAGAVRARIDELVALPRPQAAAGPFSKNLQTRFRPNAKLVY